MDRMVVNAAIETLIGGNIEEWQSAAQTVIDFGVKISPSGALVKQTRSTESSSSDDTVTGYSPGAGNVEVRTPPHREVKETYSAPIERVGYYRMTHIQHIHSLQIDHYRESGPFRKSPEDGNESGYLLTYTQDFRPDSFCKLVLRETALPFRIRLIFRALFLLRYLLLLPVMLKARLQGERVVLRRQVKIFRGEFVVINSVRTNLTPGTVLDGIPM